MITWRYECVSTTPSRGSSTLRVSRWVPVELLSSCLILVNWSGFAHDPLCVYINGTGRDYYEFYIQLNRCGTLGGNTHNALNRKHPSVSNLVYSFFGLFWFHQLHCDGNVRVKDTVEWSSHRLQMIPAGGFILLTLFYFILFYFLFIYHYFFFNWNRRTSCGTRWASSTVPWSRKNGMSTTKLLASMATTTGRRSLFPSLTSSKFNGLSSLEE